MFFETVDEQWLKVRSGASDFRLACLPAADFPAWPSELGGGDVEELTVDAPMLLEMIEKTIYSAGESDTRYTLNGLLFHVKPENKTFTVVGTDGHRLAIIIKQIDSELKEGKEDNRAAESGFRVETFPPVRWGRGKRKGQDYYRGKTPPFQRRNQYNFSQDSSRGLTQLRECYP